MGCQRRLGGLACERYEVFWPVPMLRLGTNGACESSGQLVNSGLPQKWSLKWCLFAEMAC